MSEGSAGVSAIDVCGISKRFGSVVALDDVSFSVDAGELFFLLGPSGCGKTTMLRILAGIETPDTGRLAFDGCDVSELPPFRRGAPMVFQNYALWPHLSVSENVAFGLVEQRVPRAEVKTRVDEALRSVGLSGLGERSPGQLSGGQQQRVVLARALVLNPRIVLLDEPLSNLDAKLRIEMRHEIEVLHRETDITFVYVTHDQVEALSLADRLVVINEGRICAIGKPADLYHRPPNRFCAEFLGESNFVAGHIAGVEGETVLVDTAMGPWRAIPPDDRCSAAGASVTCLVRPESVRPQVPGDGADMNVFEARVESMQLTGATTTVWLRASGQDLKSIALSEPSSRLTPGASATWVVDAQKVVIVPEE